MTPSNRHSYIIPRLSSLDLFSCRTSRIHRITLHYSINSVTRAVGDDHAWETFLASDCFCRSPRRVCCAPLPCLSCICCLIQTGHPQPSCHSSTNVLWVSLPGPTGVPSDAQAGWRRGQSANPYLLHCWLHWGGFIDTCYRTFLIF